MGDKQSYDFNLSVGITELLDADSAAKVEGQIEKHKQKLEQPVEIKVQLNVQDAKARIKELQAHMTGVARAMQKITNKKGGFSTVDYDNIAKYHGTLQRDQREIDNITRQLKEQGVTVRNNTKEYKALQAVLEDIGYVEKKKKTTSPRKNAASEVKKQTAAEKEHIKSVEESAEAAEAQAKAGKKTKKTHDDAAAAAKERAKAEQEVNDVGKTQGKILDTVTAKTQKQTDAIKKQEKATRDLAKAQQTVNVKKQSTKTMADFQRLWSKASKNYSAEDFGKRYGHLMESISGDNPTMTIDAAYKELQKKDREYRKQLAAENAKSQVKAVELQAFNAAMSPLMAQINASEQLTQQYAKALEEITAGSLTAAAATERLQEALSGLNKQAKHSVGGNKPLNMEYVIRRYNELMERNGLEGRTIGNREETKGWNLRDMVASADEALSFYHEVGHVWEMTRYSDDKDERRQWKSETDRLKRFIKAYEPYIEGLYTTIDHPFSEYSNTRDNPALNMDIEPPAHKTYKLTKAQKNAVQQHIKANQKQTAVANEMQAFLAVAEPLQKEIDASERALEEFPKILSDVSSGALTAAAATERLQAALRGTKQEISNIVYHAGDLSNITKTQKSFPLGNVPPRKSTGIGGLTGLYTTEDVDGFWGTEWSGAPISTIDISGYKLFNARSNDIADKVGAFLSDLNAAIYGYYEAVDEKDWTLARHTDVKSIEELYKAHKELFKESTLSIEQFTQFINDAAAKIAGKAFADIQLPAIDEGIAKSGISSALQDVSEELFQSDSFQTQFLKMLGYEGVDLRGTKYGGTYTGGTVLFDPKKESIVETNAMWSDVMRKHGYEIDESSLEMEKKRRQLALDTANAYSKQAEESQEVAVSEKSAQETAKAKLTAIQRQAYNYRRPAKNADALSERTNTLSGRLDEITAIRTEFPALAKACDAAESAVAETIGALQKLAQATEGVSVAADHATQQTEEQTVALREQSAAQPKPVTKLTVSEYQAAFGGDTLGQFLAGFNIKGQAANDIADIAVDAMRGQKMMIEGSQSGDAEFLNAGAQLFNESVRKASVEIMNLGTTVVGTDDVLKDFYAYMNGKKIRYNESDKAEFAGKAEWNVVRQRFSNVLTASSKGVPIDTIWEEILGLFPGLFDDSIVNEKEQLMAVLDMLGKARDAKKNNWQNMTPIHGSADEVQGNVISVFTDMGDAMAKAMSLQARLIAGQEEMADAAERATRELQAQNAERQRAADLDTQDDEDTTASIIERDQDRSLEQIRNALQNKTNLVDLSGVFSADNLEDKLRTMVNNILGDQSQLSVDSIIVQDDMARISLYNKELGVTVAQIYRLTQAKEDANKMQLELTSESYKHSPRAQLAYTDAQQRKIDADDRWLTQQLSKLDTQERKYKYSSKKISGSTALENADVTSLADDAEQTIDGLVAHIKNRISGAMDGALTDDIRNSILNDLRVLDNEIKVQQYKQYASTTMKPTELAEAKKEMEYMLDTLESKAKKNNVFSQMAQDLASLRTTLASVTDGAGLGAFVDSLRTAKSKLTSEIAKEQNTKKEEQNYQNLLRIQERLYEAKKKLAVLEEKGDADSADGQKASRRVTELQEQYNAAEKLVTSQENLNAAMERGARLQAEVDAVRAAEQTKQTETKEKKFTSDIKSTYNEMLSVINQINNLDTKMGDLAFKDKGTGLYAGVMQNLEMQKAFLLNDLNTLQDDLARVLSINPMGGQDALSLLFQDARVQAALTVEEIQNIQNAFMQTENIRFNLGAKLSEQVQPVIEKITRLIQLINSGDITDTGIIRNMSSINATIGQKSQAFQADSSPLTAMDFMRYVSDIAKYISELDKAAKKEREYFSNKREYADVQAYDAAVQSMSHMSYTAISARQKLDAFVNTFSAGTAVITGFTQSADGISKVDFAMLDSATQQFRTFSAEMGQLNDKVYTYETSMKNLSTGTTAAQKALASMSEAMARLNQLQLAGHDVSGSINSMWQLMQNLQTQLTAVGDSKDVGSQTMLKNLAAEALKAVKDVAKLETQWAKTQQAIDEGQLIDLGAINQTGDKYAQMYAKIRAAAGSATISNQKFDDTTNTLTYTLTEADGKVVQMTAHMDALTGTVTAQEGKVSHLRTAWQDVGVGIKGIGKEALRYATNLFQVMDIVRYMRTGFNEVLAIDTALTELRKVTDETSATYNNFLQTMSKTGAVVGSTVKDLITSASDWARLGYELEQAGKLAENTMVLMNVSEFDNVNDATDTLISAIQAFKSEDMDVGDFSMDIIDVFNQIGNSYAISTSDLADSLTRSSASLVAANNSLEQAVALTTAANTTIQNPETVGTTLKTLSMRIRGVKTELEEAGEDVEGMITNASKLQAKVEALTNVDGKGGINILTNTGEFKSTYDILLEISKVWKQMGDMDQAALLEIIAGKRAGSVVAGILQNGDILENAYKDALGADGSAMKELNTYLDSIQGKVDQFNNATQTMWMNFMNADVVKFFVELATSIVKAVDNVGLLQIAVAAFFAKTAFNADSFGQFFKLDVNDVTGQIERFSFSLKGAAKNAQGLSIGTKAAAIGTQLLNSALSMGLSLLVSWALGEFIGWLDETIVTADELREKVEDLTDAYKTAKKEFSENLDDLTISSDSSKYKTLLEEFEELTKGVNAYGENISLTSDEYERYKTICETIIGVNPSIAAGYDSATKAIGNNAGALRQLIELQKEQARLASAEYVSYGAYAQNGNFENIAKNAINEFNDAYKATGKYINGEQSIVDKLYDLIWPDYFEITDYGIAETSADDFAKSIMHAIGYNPDKINEILASYSSDELGFELDLWASDYTSEIVKNRKKIAKELENMNVDYLAGETFQSQKTFIEKVLQDAKYTKKQVSDAMQEYYTDDGAFDFKAFKLGIADAENGVTYGEILTTYAENHVESALDVWKELADGYEDVDKELQSAQNSMLDTFLQVPYALREYEELSTSEQSFIADWIKNGQMFKIDEGTTQDEINAAKQTIINMVRAIAGEDYTASIKDQSGNVINVGLDVVLDTMANMDVSKGTYTQYKTAIEENLNALWTAIEKDSAKFGFANKRDLAIKLGYEFAFEEETEDDNTDKLITRITELTGESEEAIREYMDGLPPIKVTRAIEYYLSGKYDSVQGNADDNPFTIGDAFNLPDPSIVVSPEINAINTYSELFEKASSYNDILTQTNEIISNNTKVAEEYKESLEELGISKEDIAKCFEDENELIVTNAKLLKTLVDNAKSNVVTNVQLAKTQAQLEYYKLVSQLGDNTRSMMVFSEENDTVTDSILDQIGPIKNAINQYQLLEDSLLGTTSAFEKFAKAQEQDEQNTYGATYTEMAQTMYDALYKTGNVGSAQFWAAVEANVPDNIYKHLTPGKEQLSAISDYLSKNVFSTLTLDEDSFSIDYSAMENFVKKAQKAGVFSGTDVMSFGLSGDFVYGLEEGENALESFAERMGMTTTQVYAMLSEMDKYTSDGTGMSILAQLDRSTTGQITYVTSELERLYTQRKLLLEQDADQGLLDANMVSINKTESQLAGLKKQATDAVKSYAMINNAVADTSKKVRDVLPPEIWHTELKLDGDTTVKDALTDIKTYISGLEEPTVVELEIAKQDIKDELNNVSALFTQEELKLNVKVNEKTGLHELQDKLTIDASRLKDLKRYVELKNAEVFIDDTLLNNLSTQEQLLSNIDANVAAIAGKEAVKDKTQTESKDTTTSGGTNTTDSQVGKPEINQEEVEYNMRLSDDIFKTMIELAKKSVELKMGPITSQQDLAAIDELQGKIYELRQEFDNPDSIVPSADLRARLSEIQTEAQKFGVNIPVTFDPEWAEIKIDVENATEAKGINDKADVDLNNRPLVPFDTKHFGSWIDYYQDILNNADQYGTDYVNHVKEELDALKRGDSTATVYSQTYYKSDFGELQDGESDAAIVVTPILPDGTVLSPSELEAYAQQLLNGEEIEPNITLGFFDGENFTADAQQFAEGLHEAQAELYGLSGATQNAISEAEALYQVYASNEEKLALLNALEDKKRALTGEELTALGIQLNDGEILTVAGAIARLTAEQDKLQQHSLWDPEWLKKSVDFIYTYSELQNQVANFNNALLQTKEIISDNTQVSQEYKDSLKELGLTDEEINECFDDTNSLVVKNAKLLHDLVKNSKKNVATNIKLAKSQAQLKYYELYKEMAKYTDGTKTIDDATLNNIDSLYDQMGALEQTIAKYSMLEAHLLGATNAYDQLADAQNADSEIDYGSKAEEMANVLASAFKSAELGTQAAQVAIAGLIPDDVIDKTKTLDEQMQQIYDYFTTGKVSKLFTIEYDDDGGVSSVEMTKENVESFTKELIDAGQVFHGTWDEFTLNPAIKTLEDFAKQIGVTEEVAFAYLTELEKYDINWLGGDHETLLDQLMGDNLEYKIQKTTKQLAELTRQKASLMKGGITSDEQKEINEINAKINELNGTLDTHKQTAYNTWQQYSDCENALAGLDKLNKQTKLTADQAAELGLIELGLAWDKDKTVQQYYDEILAKQALLAQPTPVVLQFAREQADKDLEALATELGKDPVEVKANVKLNAETGEWEYKGDTTNWSEDAKTKLQGYLENLNSLEKALGTSLKSVETNAQRSADATERTATATESINNQISGDGTGSGNKNDTNNTNTPTETSNSGATTSTGGKPEGEEEEWNWWDTVGKYQDTLPDTDSGKLADLTKQLETAQADIDTITAAKTAIETEVANLTTQLEQAKADVVAAQTAQSTYAADLATAIAEKTNLEASITDLTSKLEAANASLISARGQAEGARAEIAVLTQDKKALELKYADLTTKLDKATADLEAATTDKDAANALVATLTAEKDALASSIADISTKLNAATVSLTDAQSKLATASATIATLENDKAALQSSMTQLTADLATANNALSAALTAQATAESTIATLNAEKDALTTSMSNLATKLNSVNTELETVKGELDTVKSAKAAADATIATLTAEKDALSTSVSNLTTELNTVKTEFETVKSELATVTSAKDAVDATVEALTTKKTELESTVATMTAEMEKVNNELAAVNAAKAAAEQTIAALTQEKTSLESNVASLTQTNAELDKKIATLNDQITASNAELTSANTAIATLTEEKATLEGNIASLTQTNADLNTQVADMTTQLNTANADLAAANANVATLTAEKSALEANVSALEQTIEELNKPSDDDAGTKGTGDSSDDGEEEWLWWPEFGHLQEEKGQTDVDDSWSTMDMSVKSKLAEGFTTKVEVDTESAEDKVEDLGDKTKQALTVEDILVNEGLDDLQLEKALYDSGFQQLLSGLPVLNFDPTIFTQVLTDAGYTEKQIDSLISKIQEYNNVVLAPSNSDPLGLSDTGFSVDSLKISLSKLGVQFADTFGKIGDNKDEIQINMPDLVSKLQQAGWTPTAINAYLNKLFATSVGNHLIVPTDQSFNVVDNWITLLRNLNLDLTTEYDVSGEGKKDLGIINAQWANVPTSKTTRYTIFQTTISDTIASANGTAHAQGTAHKGGSWGAPKTETSLTGELGPELRVRGNKWELLGENGAEFNEVRKGDIIFNHKQTEELLTNGYITGRGKAFAEGTIGGTAYALPRESGVIGSKKTFMPVGRDGTIGVSINTFDDQSNKKNNKDNNNKSDKKKEKEEKEIFDWIEVKLEEIDESINLSGARLENAIGSVKQNAIIDNMIGLNQDLYNNLVKGANEYYAYANKLLNDVPAEYRKAAQDGKIAIEEFAGEADKETLEAIQKYREWVQKGADATQRAEEVLTEIQNLAKQAIDNIAQEYENKLSIPQGMIEQLEAYNALIETTQGSESAKIYEEMAKQNNAQIEKLTEQRRKMQEELNAQVEAGNIKKYSQAWYDAVSEIAAVDTEIINLTADTEDYKDAINDIHSEHFDNLISRFEAISDEAEHLIDILSNEDLVDKDTGAWTDEGITSLGLYAQQMEVAEMQAKKYKEEIQYLNKNWKKLGYTEQEYMEKLEELKNGQYDAIKSYNDTKKAIVDLTKERVDAIKEGIEKEIEAYEELISKKKEELDAEKDLYDFQKGVANQQKEIAQIERKLAALSSDNSASARAQRAVLLAELAEKQQELEDTYYDRSVSNQQEALDKELEAFQEEKDKEMEGWDEYLEDTEKVVADGLATVQFNTESVYNTLQELGAEYSLNIADALTSPWEDGESAIQSYSEKFSLGMSKTVNELKKIAEEHKAIIDDIEAYGNKHSNTVSSNVAGYQNAEYIPSTQQAGSTTPEDSKDKNVSLPQKGSKVTVKTGATHWGAKSGSRKMADFVPGKTYTVSNIFGTGSNAQILLSKKDQNKKSKTYGKTVYMGWINLQDLEGYASGTTGVKNSQLAWIDELGEELVIRPSNGRMTFMEKGTGVIPADLTSNLMEWGELDPSIMLDRNKPVISAPHVTNNNVEIHMDIAEVVHIDTVTNDTMPNLTKTIEKQLDKYMKNVNNNIRKYTR